MQNLKNFFIIFISSIMLSHPVIAATIPTTSTGIPLDKDWKQKVYAYAKNNVVHPAWGIAHSERNYQLSLRIANQEGIKIDRDVIFASAFLHDLGAIDAFRKKDVEHATRSVELAEPLLASFGFPMDKWPRVKSAILDHMYYAERPTENDAIVFHDADTLDFFGAIGIIRITSITGKHMWAPNLLGAIVTLRQFKLDLPATLVTSTARQIAAQRSIEMNQFFDSLDKETFNDIAT